MDEIKGVGRDPETGRFMPGNKAHRLRENPGRKPKNIEKMFYQALKDRVSLEDWNQMVDEIVAIAKGKAVEGYRTVKPADRLRAFQILAEYLAGKPTQPMDVRMKTTEYVKELLRFE